MPPPTPSSSAVRGAAVAASALALLGACGTVSPSLYVSSRTAPPRDVARKVGAPAPAAPPQPQPQAPEPVPAPRSLADLVDLALAREPATRATWHDARAAAAQAGSQRSLYWPSLEATASLLRQRSGGGPNRASSTSTTAGASASLTWLLLDLGARGALVDAADRLLVAARLAEHAAVADLVLQVQQTYFQYLGARALAEAEKTSVRQAETSLAAAEARRQAGLATIADVLQARTALSQVQLVLQQAEGQALALRGALATLAGLSPTAELEVGALPAEVDTARARPTVDELLALAAARNPDVARARALADAADARARAASRAAWPTLSFQASAGRTHYLAPEGLDPTTSWSAGLVLRVPMFEGLGPAYDALAARATADAARARADAAGQRVALDVWTSYQGLSSAGRRLETSRDLLASARASSDVARGRYQEGVGSILDLLNAQSALETAQAENVRARSDYLVALAQLTRASGRLDLPAAAPAAPAPSDPQVAPPALEGTP
ncbi:TolC family protein [Anaeromyxobacter sp. SG66]|uniref:TolC family protein n=1 Tax=Anaeromyxobacter sp. SG66 TaxID=2925410 RepID=UPI001F56740E|nr:TolC family protein [Anaeromyxobacter sp. SG66]